MFSDSGGIKISLSRHMKIARRNSPGGPIFSKNIDQIKIRDLVFKININGKIDIHNLMGKLEAGKRGLCCKG